MLELESGKEKEGCEFYILALLLLPMSALPPASGVLSKRPRRMLSRLLLLPLVRTLFLSYHLAYKQQHRVAQAGLHIFSPRQSWIRTPPTL